MGASRKWLGWLAVSVLASMTTGLAQAEDNMFAEYRAMFGDDNPADFVVDDGAKLWKTARGPNKVSLEQCDLGLGKGVVKGAYAQLPRYFADGNRVMDASTRVMYCMVTLQGFKAEDIAAVPYSKQGQPQTEFEQLLSYVAAQSKGMPLKVSQAHPKEKAAFALGQQVFSMRAGPYDFACSTCHRQSGKRIRLQSLPDLTTAEGAKAAYTTWPGYRISEGTVRTMDWRMADCARQQRLPELKLGSDISVALISYMAVMANGGEMAAPGLKR